MASKVMKTEGPKGPFTQVLQIQIAEKYNQLAEKNLP